MNEFATKLKILRDALLNKEQILKAILGICENQESVYVAMQDISKENSGELRALLNGLNIEKQSLIDDVNASDSGFTKLYAELSADSDTFVAKCRENAETVEEMQELVEIVTDLDVKIRLCERRNEELAKNILRNYTQQAPAIDIPKTMPNKLMKTYQQNTQLKKKK